MSMSIPARRGARQARERLLAEGVTFRGRAAGPVLRIRWAELRGRLAVARGT
jgi:hypothetical protein